MIAFPPIEIRPQRDQIAPADVPGSSDRRTVRLGSCEVSPGARALLRDGRRVDIGSRAFDLLMVLLRSRGTVVAKAEIIRSVWPTTIVEESNLRLQMAALREALGQDRGLIKTVPGRGYMLIDDDEPAPAAPTWASGGTAFDRDGAHMLENSLIFVVEQDQEFRDALLQFLRPFRARIVLLSAADVPRQNAGEAA